MALLVTIRRAVDGHSQRHSQRHLVDVVSPIWLGFIPSGIHSAPSGYQERQLADASQNFAIYLFF